MPPPLPRVQRAPVGPQRLERLPARVALAALWVDGGEGAALAQLHVAEEGAAAEAAALLLLLLLAPYADVAPGVLGEGGGNIFGRKNARPYRFFLKKMFASSYP